jgi:F-type H+-transporting ATPase subunit a
MDPIHQFEIKKFFVLGHIGGAEIAFTNSALYMLIALAVIALLMIGAREGGNWCRDGSRPPLKFSMNLSRGCWKEIAGKRE